jgi:tetratricopeptide (TPR) repeat protein
LDAGNAALVEGDATGALQNLVRGEALDSSIPELYHSKAIAYFGKHSLTDAVEAARQAVRLRPNYSDANNTLGKLLMDSKQYPEAVAPLLSAAQDTLYRDSFKAWTNLGILKFQVGDMHEAKVYFERAILDAPQKSCIAYFYRGQMLEKEDHLQDAIEDYQRGSKRLCALYGDAQFALGVAYGKNKNYQGARKVFLDIHERFPNTSLSEKAMLALRDLP